MLAILRPTVNIIPSLSPEIAFTANFYCTPIGYNVSIITANA